MVLLTRTVHADKTMTFYWRCPSCSHVQIEEASADKRYAKGPTVKFKKGR